MRQTVAAKGSGVAAASRFAKRASYNNIRAFQQRADSAHQRPRMDIWELLKDYNQFFFSINWIWMKAHVCEPDGIKTNLTLFYQSVSPWYFINMGHISVSVKPEQPVHESSAPAGCQQSIGVHVERPYGCVFYGTDQTVSLVASSRRDSTVCSQSDGQPTNQTKKRWLI